MEQEVQLKRELDLRLLALDLFSITTTELSHPVWYGTLDGRFNVGLQMYYFEVEQ